MGKKGKPLRLSQRATPEQKAEGNWAPARQSGTGMLDVRGRRVRRSASRKARGVSRGDWVIILDALAFGVSLNEALTIPAGEDKKPRTYSMYDLAKAINKSPMRQEEFLDTLRLRQAAGKITKLVSGTKTEGEVGQIMWLIGAVDNKNAQDGETEDGAVAEKPQHTADFDIEDLVESAVVGEESNAETNVQSEKEAGTEDTG